MDYTSDCLCSKSIKFRNDIGILLGSNKESLRILRFNEMRLNVQLYQKIATNVIITRKVKTFYNLVCYRLRHFVCAIAKSCSKNRPFT